MQALRTASLKLRGNLPTLDEQTRLKKAIDSAAADDAQILYESLVRSMIYDQPITFNRQMFHDWTQYNKSPMIFRASDGQAVIARSDT